jgi:hypothetical protein
MTKQFNDWLKGKDEDKVMVAMSKTLLFMALKESFEGKSSETKKQAIYEKNLVAFYYGIRP